MNLTKRTRASGILYIVRSASFVPIPQTAAFVNSFYKNFSKKILRKTIVIISRFVYNVIVKVNKVFLPAVCVRNLNLEPHYIKRDCLYS